MFNLHLFFVALLVCVLIVGIAGGVYVFMYHNWWPIRAAGAFAVVLCFSAIVGLVTAL